ncbi:DNA mismatch endonuclease Vsr [Bradyrhizobium sp. LVM 105]|uniref:very short patch repair endonuclease n=1 Tax=Bradyrhizobium sp. LVM 105 TaxID=2341115 RepID=UPI000F80FD8E|nr:DNA mismatch endonuclease Vsr [Bradyrhizobium sp. LVM 105]RTE93076.1 DNA mismatch endonuclease Vsr [Bradyrhizobium sp. LVM 105]
MADTLDKQQRSALMSRIGPSNSKPEMAVRSCLHGLGFRFGLHNSRLLGTPDIVLRKHKTLVFVHGCFWHRHTGCRKATSPKTRVEFWQDKFLANVRRDRRVRRKLRADGWRVITVWECQTVERDRLIKLLARHLSFNRN